MGFFKAEGLISGWVGKIRNNLNFRITRQGRGIMLCPVNDVKVNLGV
jgi:hypothetical protein